MNLQIFQNKIKAINPEGRIDQAHQAIINIISFGREVDNVPVTFEFIIKKYAEYVKSWNIKYSKKLASGYLAKDKELKTIDQFMNDAMYKQEFQMGQINVERDNYLFGNDLEDIYGKIQQSKQIIEKERKKFN